MLWASGVPGEKSEWSIVLSQAGNPVTLGFPVAWCGVPRNTFPASLQMLLFTVSLRTM